MGGWRLFTLLMLALSFSETLQENGAAKKILLYPVAHCYNSLLLTMEKMASFLTANGYDVSILINDKYGGTKANINMTSVELVTFPAPRDVKTVCDLEGKLSAGEASMADITNVWMNSTLKFCEALLDSSVLESLKMNNYNLLIVERSDWCSAIIAEALEIPFATFASSPNAFNNHELVRFMHTPSIISPAVLTWPMSFKDRLVNVFFQLFVYSLRGYFSPPMNALKMKHAIRPSRYLTEVYDDAILTFLNSDQRVDYPRPLYSHEIEIGFLFPQISRSTIPDEILRFIDPQKQTVLVSLGTQVGNHSRKFAQITTRTFSTSNYNVILKAENFTNAPSNVLALPWIPQSDLLASGLIDLFITHGGFASSMESIYHGVPMVVVPMQGEQMAQAQRLSNYLEVSYTLDYLTLTSDSLTSAVNRALEKNCSIRTNVAVLSNKIKHGLVDPSETFLYWINQSIYSRHATVNMPAHPPHLNIFQWLVTDLLAVYLLIGIVAIFIAVKTCVALGQLSYKLYNRVFVKVKAD